MITAPSRQDAADPPRRPVLFVNPRAGDGKAARAGVVERAQARGLEVEVVEPDTPLAVLVERAVARGADALAAAGGDGSLATVAAAAVEHDLPFVCIPAGTRNHFALDVGLDPDDPVGALDAFTDGVERRIDVAEVNGRLFLNNVSLGVYGEAVRAPSYRDAKARTFVETSARVLGPGAAANDLDVVDDCGDAHRSPAVVLVSNNPYTLEPPGLPGTRAALDTGRLGIVVVDAPPAGSVHSWTATHLEVNGRGPVHAGIDGEAAELSRPLRFVIRPGALRVRQPRGR